MSYNGWSNYETFLVNLWLTNEFPGILPGTTAAGIEETLEALMEGVELPGMLSDLLRAAIARVDCVEIATDNKA